MTRYAIGQPIRLSTVVTDSADVAADPTDIAVTTYNATDGTTTTYAYNPGDIVRDSAGHFHLDLTALTVAGHYSYVWLATGTNAGAGPAGGNFELYDPLSFRVVSIEDARAYLRLVDGADVAGDDARLADIIAAVTAALIRLIGPMVPTTYIDTAHADGVTLQLPHGPVRSVTTFTPLSSDAATVLVSDLQVLPGDVLRRLSGVGLQGWYRVTYSAGTDTVPDDVRVAALDWILHKWRQAQAHTSATYGELGGPVTDFSGPPNSVLNGIRHLMVKRSGV